MPRRLRIAFPPGAARTLACSTGSYSVTGRSAQLTYVPNAVVADTWSIISTPAYEVTGDSRGGPYVGQGWMKAAINTTNGQILLSEGTPTTPQGGNFIFDPGLKYWIRTNTDSVDWKRSMQGYAENYNMTYDPDRNCFYRSSGGPFARGNAAGPYYGDGKYDVATDIWSTPYPQHDNSYSPLPADAGYFGTPGNSLEGFDCGYNYYNGAIYQFGNYSVGGAQNLKKRDIATGVISTLAIHPNVPPQNLASRTPHLRSGFDTRTKKLYTFADNMAYYEYDLSKPSSVWTLIPTTGIKPQVAAPALLDQTPTDWGMMAIIDEASNCAVAWCGRNASTKGFGEWDVRTTWIMDLATREWRLGPNLAAGHTVPPGKVSVLQSLLYDPVNRRTVLTTETGSVSQVWALNIAPIGGKITSWPLPSYSGGVWGVNYNSFPYTANGNSKHTNMGYCPLNNRLYVSGGDMSPAGSANDGVWSMSLDDGSWRLDHPRPTYPTTPAPHAYQDGDLFVWMPSRQKFLFGFGSVFGYEADGSAIFNYSNGYWMYDPIAVTWTQVSGLFPNPTLQHFENGTGNEFGGVYDETTDCVYVLGDSSSGAVARRWSIASNTQLSSVAYTIPPSGLSGFTAAYFLQSRQCQLGRYIYTLGYYTNGVDTTPTNAKPLFFRWGIDDHTMTKLTAPPVFTQNVNQKELVLCVSNGKLVHPRRYGPDGEMPEGVYVYNPANDTWTQDTKIPAYGAYIQNSVCSLPDGRVAMSGGVFGRQQTHMWFYEAT